jgi:hypothetical protein
VITRTKVDFGKDFSTDKLMKQDIDAGQWVLVLDSDGVQWSVVHT